MSRKPHKGLQTLEHDKGKFPVLVRLPLETVEKLDRLSTYMNMTRACYMTHIIDSMQEST